MPQNMMEILRDPAWQFIGAMLALFGIGGMFWIYWLQRQSRELTFGIVSSRRPLAIADELSSRVTVQLDGKLVQNLHLLVFGLKNSGQRAIAPSDFQSQLAISFPEGQVVSAEIASQLPSNLGGLLSISESQIQLAPLLLNPNDQILIQVLLSATNPAWSVDTRILDISSLTSINSRPKLPSFFESGLPVMMLICILTGIYFIFFGEQTDRHAAYMLFGFAALTPIFRFILVIIYDFGNATRRRISEV